MDKLDRLGWAEGMSFEAYGLRVGVRTNRPGVLETLLNHLPPGWSPLSSPEVQQLYSVIVGGDPERPNIRRFNILYANAVRVVRTMNLKEVIARFESNLRLYVGARAHDWLFVHAGVVGWNGRAILIPGHSRSGKTTLVRALCERGATYYSDEFAVFDKGGYVHPFPTPLSIRGELGERPTRLEAEALGARVGTRRLRVGLVAVTRYDRAARGWRPRRLPPGRAALALLAHTVPARLKPGSTLATLSAAAPALALKGTRADAAQMVGSLLKRVELMGSDLSQRSE